jgi:hypothetical protein
MSDKEVLFDPFPKQVEFLEAIFSFKFQFVLYGGAIRGGKTFAGIGALFILCKAFPGSRWAIVRTDLQTLKRNTIPSFWKVAPSKFVKSYNQETQTVTMTNGSQIIFFGENYADDKELNRWKGLEVNGFLFEEINELQEKTFSKGIERAGSHIIPKTDKQPPPIIIGTCNPTQNWVKDRFYTPYKLDTLNPAFKYIPAKIFDNPFISEAYLTALKNMPQYEYDVFVNGDWDIELKTGGEFYKSFDLDSHTADHVYNSLLPIHISFDENVNPYITATVWQSDEHDKNKVYQIKEYCLESPNNTVRKLCDAVIRDFYDHSSGMFIYGDATSKKADTKLEKGHNFFTLIRDYLIKFNPVLRVPASNPSVVMRGNFINQIWERGFLGIEISIDRNCKNSIVDFNKVKEDNDGTKKKETTKNPNTGITYQMYGHTSDANDYFICEYFKTEFRQYQTGRTTFDHVVIGENFIRQNNSY